MSKQIIYGPHITEKSMAIAPLKRYVFEVSTSANKAEIAYAVAKTYNVTVLAVKTANCKGKIVRFKQRFPGKKKDTKKAIVAIDSKQTIKDFVVKE